MPSLIDFIRRGRQVIDHRPWPRAVLSGAEWSAAAAHLAAGEWTLLGLWGETRCVHMALLEEETAHVAVASLDCPDGRYPSIGQSHAPALRLERAVHDLFGLVAVGLPDTRPWLDHGRWGLRHPLGAREIAPGTGDRYGFLAAEGPELHQIPVGPVHAGIIEPGHFRFSASGETVVRLEARLGYAHKGIEGLMHGGSLDRAVRLAGRTSGDSTVAYALAFSRAAEAALQVEAPRRAQWLRALMAELERIANHLGDFGAVCNDASFAILHVHCGVLRERVLRAAEAAFGHRLMRDRILPGGVAGELDPAGARGLRQLIDELRRGFPKLVELYDTTASLQDRTVTTGVLSPALAGRYGAGGYVGRASGRAFDARRAFRYSPYDVLSFEVPVRTDGDVNARVWLRVREIEQSLSLLDQILDGMPAGPTRIDLAAAPGRCEGMAIVEGFRGDVLAWLSLAADGLVARCHLRDPSWFQWPLLEAAVEGNIVADFPLCNKSFNCSYSGHDL